MRADDIRVLEQRLSEVTQMMGELGRRIETADPKLRETYRARLHELHDRREAIEKRLAELRLDQALEWEKIDFAMGLERVVERLTRGMDRPIPRH